MYQCDQPNIAQKDKKKSPHMHIHDLKSDPRGVGQSAAGVIADVH